MLQHPKNRRRRLWPAVLCWLLMMLGTFTFAIAEFIRWPVAGTAAFIGFACGQLALAAILGGLLGRSSIAGWLLAVSLASLGTAVYDLGALRYTSQQLGERLVFFCLWPGIMLAACAPFVAMRGLRGWSLTLGERTAMFRTKPSIEDLLLLSVVVGCSLSWLRLASVLIAGLDATNEVLFVMLMFFIFSLLFVVPAVAVTFRARSWGERLLGWAVIMLVASAVCLLLNRFSFFSGGRSISWPMVVDVAAGVGTCSLTMAVGAWALLACRFKLTRFEPPEGDRHDESRDSEALALMRSTRRQARCAAAAVVIATLAGSGWAGYRDVQKQKFLESVQAWGSREAHAGSSIAIKDDQVISLTVAPDTTDASFSHFENLRDLQRLSLAHSQITDNIVIQLGNFPKLRILDLSDTPFSDAGLDELWKRSRPKALSVANTRVSFSKALRYAASTSINALDVGELGITDDQLSLPSPCTVASLGLSGNPITDKGLANLLQSWTVYTKLDVSNIDIDGSGLVSRKCPSILVLDGTKITDANLIAILNANPGIDVSLKNTAITAAVLPVAAKVGAKLSLGGGKITEQDLLNLGPTSFNGLSLNGPEFNGACFNNGRIQVRSLDLSHSSATDASLAQLNFGGVYLWKLDLSHTRVTDAILPVLQALACAELDLRHTHITAAGLMRTPPQFGYVVLSHDQFTPAELVSLRRHLRVRIDQELQTLP